MSKIDVDQTIYDLEAGKPPEWISDHVRVYRESGGADGHLWDDSSVGIPCLLLTTIGRRSREKRTSPVLYRTAGNAYVLIGSKGGADTHPNWYLNLRANPIVEVQVANDRFDARARVVTGKERDQIWQKMIEEYPYL